MSENTELQKRGNCLKKQLIGEEPKSILLELDMEGGKCTFPSTISSALVDAESELKSAEYKLVETMETIAALTPDCDKLDYILAACSGALCGVIDIFLVGKPGESYLGKITDKWFAKRTIDFAKLCGYDGKEELSSAVRFLEKKFKIPYDQSTGGDVFKEPLELTPENHHYKSLGHNPTLLGLFFSILDQFNNTSSFVANNELITLKNSYGKFELLGGNLPGKIFCGFANWIGHLISDISGSSGSKGRGMGIPSPIWSWINDVIAIKRTLKIAPSDFDRSINELALNIFKKGYDARFQAVQTIPVLINEFVVRLIYSIRRFIKYLSVASREDRGLSLLLEKCEPFSNASVKRMLTVAHGCFCMLNTSGAMIYSIKAGLSHFNICEFFLRLNIIGVGRFTVSLYGEAERIIQRSRIQKDIFSVMQEKVIIEDYLEGLKNLSVIYDDEALLTFVDDFRSSGFYKEAFEKTVALAEKRNVPENKILKSKADIDSYFQGGS